MVPNRLDQRRVAGFAGASLTVALLAFSSTSALAQQTEILHDDIGCWPAGEHIVVRANVQPPGDVMKASLYFRWDRHAAWYFVPMSEIAPGTWQAIPPKTVSGTTGTVYFLEVLDNGYVATRSREYRVPVKKASECAEDPAVVIYSGNPQTTVGSTQLGATQTPPGFDPAGIGRYISPTGMTSGTGGGGGIGKPVLFGAAGGAAVLTGVMVGGSGSEETNSPAAPPIGGAPPPGVTTTTVSSGPPSPTTTTSVGSTNTTSVPSNTTTTAGSGPSTTTVPGGTTTTVSGSTTTTAPGTTTSTAPGTSTTTAPGTSTTTAPGTSTTTSSPPTTTTTSSPPSTTTTSTASTTDLSISISDNPDPATVGTRISYTITIKNVGSAPAILIDVRATLSSHLTGKGGNKCGASGSTGSCSAGALNPGESWTGVIRADAVSTGTGRITLRVKWTDTARREKNASETTQISNSLRTLEAPMQLEYRSDLQVEPRDGSVLGQVVVDAMATAALDNTGPQVHRFEAEPGTALFEAHIAPSGRRGSIRFDFSGTTGITPGSLRVQSGRVRALDGLSVTFAVGPRGEALRFTVEVRK